MIGGNDVQRHEANELRELTQRPVVNFRPSEAILHECIGRVPARCTEKVERGARQGTEGGGGGKEGGHKAKRGEARRLTRQHAATQWKLSKCPVRIRSPIGDGARFGRCVPAAIVFERRDLRGVGVGGSVGGVMRRLISSPATAFLLNCGICGCSARQGMGSGEDTSTGAQPRTMLTLAMAPPSDSRRSTPVARSCC